MTLRGRLDRLEKDTPPGRTPWWETLYGPLTAEQWDSMSPEDKQILDRLFPAADVPPPVGDDEPRTRGDDNEDGHR